MYKHYFLMLLCAMATQTTVLAQQHAIQPQPVSPQVSGSTADDVPIKIKRGKIQIVFALDATGSMSGLMAAAKDKIWSIAGSITQSDPAPELELGLVFYRDRGDAFVTKRVPLTDSIDYVYKELMGIRAEGGGDSPESVNQGLYEAVTMFAWDESPEVYKTVFLIGDQAPHMKYTDDVKYPQTCIIAKGKDIVLNTILMGNDPTARKVWNEIANCSMGSFVNVNMGVNDIAVKTPFDEDIAKMNDELEGMTYYYGSAHIKNKGAEAKQLSEVVITASRSNVKAQRAEYKMKYAAEKSKSSGKSYDLLKDVMDKKIDVNTLKQEELPDELQKMTEAERKTFIEGKLVERKKKEAELQEKIKQRNAYIKESLSKKNAAEVKNSFNNIIYENIKQQTKKKNIELTGEAKY
ncbi:MAG: hypothetical protein KF880_07215 [Ferruginibacter sp.]|nr:hypothetical protein [Ferruginibacter sp.]